MEGLEAASSRLVHRTLVYDGEEEVLTHLAAFARQGVADGEATMVLASARRLRTLRREVGADAGVGWVPNHLGSMRIGTAFDDIRRQVAGRAGGGRLRVAADWDLSGRTGSERRAFMRWEAAATAILAEADATFLCCHDGADPHRHEVVGDPAHAGVGAELPPQGPQAPRRREDHRRLVVRHPLPRERGEVHQHLLLAVVDQRPVDEVGRRGLGAFHRPDCTPAAP